MKVKTIIFDVCGVLGDCRGTVPWKVKVAMEEATLSEKYGIGFTEIITAYTMGGFDDLWRKYKVDPSDIGQYFTAWDSIPEYPLGSVRIYPEVPFVLNKLMEAGVDIALFTRLTNQGVMNVLKEIKRRGFEGDIEDDIKVFNPETDDVRKNDEKFIEKVMFKAYEETQAPRIYIDDGLDRIVQFREWDSNLFAIGSARGFYSVKDLQTTYYLKSDGGLVFENFESELDASKKGYSKLFNDVITTLENLSGIIPIGLSNISRGDER